MSPRLSTRQRRAAAVAAGLVAMAGAFALGLVVAPRGAVTVTPGTFPEELVYARSTDDFVNAGAMFTASKAVRKATAVIWVHGWGVNFSSPTYTVIGRELAAGGYTTIAANTRMHDVGNVLGHRRGKRIRGGGYWGAASEQARDLEGWADFAEGQGFSRLVLVGHSAGAAAVREYQADSQDPRVVGLVLASGSISPDTTPPDPQQLAEARRMMDAGTPDDLVRIPGRAYPSFISAATFLDIAETRPEFKDFFGVRTANPAVARIRCPLLAFFGTASDVGNDSELKLLEAAVARHGLGPSSVTTLMIDGADHMYAGREKQVAAAIAAWIDRIS